MFECPKKKLFKIFVVAKLKVRFLVYIEEIQYSLHTEERGDMRIGFGEELNFFGISFFLLLITI